MKKAFLEFEEAHTILLCMLYLPIPEFVGMLFFQENSMVRHVLCFLMVLELIVAGTVYLIWHRCPDCRRHISQMHVHNDCRCHFCGCYLLKLQDMIENLPAGEAPVIETFEKLDEVEDTVQI